jgi:glycerol-3-phosphate acyltransferase PlsY
LRLVLVVIIAYLIGSIPFGYLIVRSTSGGDVRETGSGGTGATNVTRRAGRAAGVFTLILDFLKGAVAVLIVAKLTPDETDWWIAAAAIAVIVGHIFPIWLAFRGGKGVATALGVFGTIAPISILCFGVIFVVVVWWRKMVSLASIAAAATIPLYFLFVERSTPIAIAGLVCVGLIVFAHRGNLTRILNGTESRISDLKR